MNQPTVWRRMLFLVRLEVVNRWRVLLVAAAVVAGIPFFLTLLEAMSGGRGSLDYTIFLRGSLIIWCCIEASRAFVSLHNKSLNEPFLLLPATVLEKVAVQFVFSSVLLPAAIVLLVWVSSLLSEVIWGVSAGWYFTPMPLAGNGILELIAYVIIAQSIFFLGSAWFKRAHLIKTLLSVLLFFVVLSIVMVAVFRFDPDFFFSIFPEARSSGYLGDLSTGRRWLEITVKVIVLGLLAPSCWFLTWLRVRRIQSSDAV